MTQTGLARSRILFVQHCSDWGGSSYSLLQLIQHLDRERYHPVVLFNAPPGDAVRHFTDAGIEVRRADGVSSYAHAHGAFLGLRSIRPWLMLTEALRIRGSARRFEAILKQDRPDIVHLNSLVQVPAAIGARLAGVPIVWHIREQLHPGYIGLRRRLIRVVVKTCAAVALAISETNARALSLPQITRVVYNPIDLTRFSPDIVVPFDYTTLGVPPGAGVVLMLGGLAASKGADLLIRAAAQVSSRETVHLVIAGNPPQGESPNPLKRQLRRMLEKVVSIPNAERAALRAIAGHGLEGAVHFIGVRHDIPELMAGASAVVWPARVPHFARPVAEACLLGRPVVASDFDSTREILIHERTGLLFAPNDPDALARAILRILEDRTLAQRLGEAARVDAQGRHDPVAGAAKVASVYEKILASDPPRAGGVARPMASSEQLT